MTPTQYKDIKNHKKRAAVFLDRDGTIIEDRGQNSCPRDIVFFDDTFSALRLLQKQFLLFIVTNQSGVGMGRISREAAEISNAYVERCLQDEGITITQVYSCFHKRDDNCSCIKPNPFFLYKAEMKYHVDLERSYVIGDHPHDIEFAYNVRFPQLDIIYLISGILIANTY
ncbi:D-glycero-alpha-D-manno-heptose-1,7-bisphosphate 7-phosphatase [Fibrobacterota bacterium]